MVGDRIIVWHDKHGDYSFSGEDAALKILQLRLNLGYLFWPDNAEEIAREIIEIEDENAAFNFLRQRNDFEYEHISEEVLR